MRFLTILLFLLSHLTLFSQSISADFYNKVIFVTDFSSAKDSKTWSSINNSDELILINNGQYVIDRKSPVTDRMLFPDYLNPFINYELSAGFSMETLIENEQYLGICFSFSHNFDQGYIIEFNRKKQFRIKRINKNAEVAYITGKDEKKSWVKNNMLMLKEGSNDITIRVLDKQYEVYINNFLAFSFVADHNYEFRNFGLFTTKATKAIFTKVQLAVNKDEIPKYSEMMSRIEDENYKEVITEKELINKENKEKEHNPEVKTEETKSVDIVINLNNQIKQLQKTLDENKLLLDRCKTDNKQLDDYIKKNVDAKLQSHAIELEKENNKLKDELSRLRTENSTLQDFKVFHQKQNQDKDIVNFLYDELKKLEEKNAFLNRQVEQLQEQIKKPKK